MARIVANERDLCKDKGQKAGIDELHPEGIYEYKDSNAESQKSQGRDRFIYIVRELPF